MNSVDTNAVLNRLRVIHNRSLPTYLTYAVPWSHAGDEAAEDLFVLAADTGIEAFSSVPGSSGEVRADNPIAPHL